jgi:LysR family glycine cleavage system transcriptional activator
MPGVQHLRALQALELAIRLGSIQRAAAELGITAAAAGQRIRGLEDYLGTDLLLRGRSGLQPTTAVEPALPDLRAAFSALDRVTETLDFQRTSEIHLVADPDLAELWLIPRLGAFRQTHPNIRFCINGEGDVPVRLGAPDIRITRSDDPKWTILFTDLHTAITGPDNLRRLGDWDQDFELEGLPLLHVDRQEATTKVPGWSEWIAQFGGRQEGAERGVHYRHLRLALEAVRRNVGFLICGLSLARLDLEAGRVVAVYPVAERNMASQHPYRYQLRNETRLTAQVRRFVDWMVEQANETQAWLRTRQ